LESLDKVVRTYHIYEQFDFLLKNPDLNLWSEKESASDSQLTLEQVIQLQASRNFDDFL